jgi:hypothetical protein
MSGDAPEKMRKGMHLTVVLYAAGDDAPAHDFAASTIETVRGVIESADYPGLSVKVESITEGGKPDE